VGGEILNIVAIYGQTKAKGKRLSILDRIYRIEIELGQKSILIHPVHPVILSKGLLLPFEKLPPA
jgi:hypothetical protein